MTTIYLPVELSRREIAARAFLATRLAREGHDVFVFASDFFDRAVWPGPGIYMGKNVFRDYVPHDLTFYKRMKAAGIRVWHHDEEGGLYFGPEPSDWTEELSIRVDPTPLGSDDKVLTWGDYQADYFRSTGTAADVQVIGTANFEVFVQDYARFFAEYDERETGGLSDYVLVNTRFTLANGYNQSSKPMLQSVTTYFDYRKSLDILLEEGIILNWMLRLVAELAYALPDRTICVRPHPGEDPKLYRDLFGPIPNVRMADQGDVGSWIRRSRCLLQNGCTTAIQAHIAGKPVITVVPPGVESHSTVPLPNEVGLQVSDAKSVIAAVRNPPGDQPSGRWRLAISRLDTIETVAALVAKERFEAAPPDEAKLKRAALQSRLDASRRALYYLMPEKLAQHRQRQRYFDPELFSRFPNFIEIAERKWDTSVELSAYSDRCWRVRPKATR